MNWIEQVFKSTEFSLVSLPASLLLGFLTAITSCCNIGIIAAVAGFAGTQVEAARRRDAVLTAVFFTVGTVISLSILGLLAGKIGGMAVGTNLRRYSIAFLGFAVIIAGLAALKLMPFKIPSVNLAKIQRPTGFLGPTIFGLAVGAASITCTLACCGPLLPVVFGMAAARGNGLWGAAILGLFAIGFSLPLAALMLGIGMGRVTSFAQKAMAPIRVASGIIMTGVGFWLLATM